MSEKSTERSAAIWFALTFYIAGGGYMLAFWGALDQAAYHLALLGILSVIVAVALYMLSRWAFWIALFTFPIFFVEFVYGLVASVNLVGWIPDAATGLFEVSMIIYLVFLCFSFVLIVDKRSMLRSDRVLESLGNLVTASKPERTNS